MSYIYIERELSNDCMSLFFAMRRVIDIYVYMIVCRHVSHMVLSTHIYIYVWIQNYMNMCPYVYIYACMHACRHYLLAYSYRHGYVCMRVYVHVYLCVYTRTVHGYGSQK